MSIFRSAGCVLLHMLFSTRCCGCGPKGPVCSLVHCVWVCIRLRRIQTYTQCTRLHTGSLGPQPQHLAANSGEGETAYSRIPKSAVIKEIRGWRRARVAKRMGRLNQWGNHKNILSSNSWPEIKKKLNMNIKLSTVVTGHGTLRAYYHRFKIINDPVCVCVWWYHRPQIT